MHNYGKLHCELGKYLRNIHAKVLVRRSITIVEFPVSYAFDAMGAPWIVPFYILNVLAKLEMTSAST